MLIQMQHRRCQTVKLQRDALLIKDSLLVHRYILAGITRLHPDNTSDISPHLRQDSLSLLTLPS